MSRPSLERKVTPKSEAARKAELDQGVKITVDGVDHVLRIGDVTPALAREVRRRLGQSVNSLINEASDDPDIDTIQALVWVARRVAGDTVDVDDVDFGYDQMFSDAFDIEIADPSSPEEGDRPEA